MACLIYNIDASGEIRDDNMKQFAKLCYWLLSLSAFRKVAVKFIFCRQGVLPHKRQASLFVKSWECTVNLILSSENNIKVKDMCFYSVSLVFMLVSSCKSSAC